MDLKYIGHSAFEIKTNDKSIIIDPLVSSNDKYDWKKSDIVDIFLTHAHNDHIGQALEIAKEKKAKITAIYELANYCSKEGADVRSINFGSWLDYEWGRALFFPAFHSTSLPDGCNAGMAASILFDIEGLRIFHAGDTCLTSEMKTIKELYRPNIAMLPIGGTYTMDIEHAAVAAEWLGAQTIIPMHYNTYPEIQADLEKFSQLIQRNNRAAVILNPEQVQ